MIRAAAFCRAIAAVAIVAVGLLVLAACVRHVELHPDAAPSDAHHNDSNDSGGLPDAFVGDGGPGDAAVQD